MPRPSTFHRVHRTRIAPGKSATEFTVDTTEEEPGGIWLQLAVPEVPGGGQIPGRTRWLCLFLHRTTSCPSSCRERTPALGKHPESHTGLVSISNPSSAVCHLGSLGKCHQPP